MFNQLIKIYRPLLYILPLILLIGCESPKEEILKCELPVLHNTSNNKSDKLDISVNVDGSGSMIGYVNTNDSNYTKALEVIGNLVTPSNSVSVEYKRIGDEQELTRDDFRRDAKSVGFYNETNPKYKGVSSSIQDAITPPQDGKDKLTIIVTDLEGDDGGKIAEALGNTYLNKDSVNKGYTVGVWAVKSQFKGEVFDPNSGNVKFSYNTEGKTAEDFRPFYVLFIGKHQEIVKQFEEIKKLDSELQTDSKMFIFPSQNIIKEAVNLGSLEFRPPLPDNNQIERNFSLENDAIVVSEQTGNEPYELLNIVFEELNKPIPAIKYKVPFPTLTKEESGDYSLAIDQTQLKTNTKLFTLGKTEANTSVNTNDSQSSQENQTDSEKENNTSQSDTENNQENELKKEDEVKQNETSPTSNNSQQTKQFFIENTSNALKQGLTIGNLTLDEKVQNLSFDTNINSDKLTMAGIYLFEVDLILNDLKDLDWWSEWDSKNKNNQNGSKTQSLSAFMTKLESQTLGSLRDTNDNVVIGRFCFAIQKN